MQLSFSSSKNIHSIQTVDIILICNEFALTQLPNTLRTHLNGMKTDVKIHEHSWLYTKLKIKHPKVLIAYNLSTLNRKPVCI